VVFFDPSQLLAVLIALAEGTRAAGRPACQAGHGEALRAILEHALVGPGSCEEYLAELESVFGARRAALSRDPISDLPVDRIMSDGVAALSDEQLVALAISPASVGLVQEHFVSAYIGGRTGEVWDERMQRFEASMPSDPVSTEQWLRIFRRVEAEFEAALRSSEEI
jgi:hypothetical protein